MKKIWKTWGFFTYCFTVAGSSLSSFMKNLILQTLLEDEKVYITVTSHGLNYSFSNNTSAVSPRHLGVGVGHSTRTVHISIYDSMEKLAKLISRPGIPWVLFIFIHVYENVTDKLILLIVSSKNYWWWILFVGRVREYLYFIYITL